MKLHLRRKQRKTRPLADSPKIRDVDGAVKVVIKDAAVRHRDKRENRLARDDARRLTAANRPPVLGPLRAPRAAALRAIATLVAAASAAAFAQSYRGLWLWARHHGLSGVWAASFPAQLDVFIAVGELTLFVALVDQWDRRSRIGAWLVTVAGLAVSVAGNVGHVTGHTLSNRATAAVPPLAAASALAVGLGVLKRVVATSVSNPAVKNDPAGEHVLAPEVDTGGGSYHPDLPPGVPVSSGVPEPPEVSSPDVPNRAADGGAEHPDGTAETAVGKINGTVRSPVPADAQSAAVIAYMASVAATNPLSQRQLMTRFGLTRSQVARVRQQVAAQANGTTPEPGTGEEVTADVR